MKQIDREILGILIALLGASALIIGCAVSGMNVFAVWLAVSMCFLGGWLCR